MASHISLWDRAVASLSSEDQQDIDFSMDDKPATLSDALEAAEEKKQLCMRKRWKYSKKNGEVVIVRDLCEKLIKWVNKFKEIGDVAVQSDPSHASLPWAAVRFFLQLSVNEVQTFGAMAEGLEKISGYITRCHLYEHFFLAAPSAAQPELESTLLRLYTSILLYLARARQYYAKSTLRRLGASIVMTSDSVDIRLAKVKTEHDEVERCTHLINTELSQDAGRKVGEIQASVSSLSGDLAALSVDMSASQDAKYHSLKAILDAFQQPILRTSIQVSDIHASLEKETRRQILSWLSTVRYREHHKSAFSTVMPGSGRWLLQKHTFIDWKSSSSSSILWIHGIPGSGKSKLMATLIQGVLNDKSKSPTTSAFAYFYCSKDSAETQRADPDEIMRALLKQLSCFDATQPIHTAVAREYEEKRRDADEDGSDPLRLSLGDCRDIILELTSQSPAIIMIDALDECDPKRRHKLLHTLSSIVQNSSNLVKIIISSRDDADIVCRLNSVPNVYIRSSDNGDDVDRFIDHELEKAIDDQRLLKGRVPEYLKKQILLALKTHANGMFLWASLQIQNLCDPERMLITRDVEDALLRPPPTLFQSYSDIMERIDRIAPHGRHLAKKTLRWLLCAREPLTETTLTQLLAFASRIEPSDEQYTEPSDLPNCSQNTILKDEILSICCNLVILDQDVFRFAHASVQDFLQTQPGFELQEINLEVAEDSLSFLLTCWQDSAPVQDVTLGKFSQYAVNYWLKHYSELDLHWRSHQQLATAVKTFFLQRIHSCTTSHATSYDIWARSFFVPRYPSHCFRHLNVERLVKDGVLRNDMAYWMPKYPNALHVACMYGLREIFDETWNRDIDLARPETNHLTALYHAASNDRQDIVEKLIELGVSPRTDRRGFHETPLHGAARRGFEGTVLLLLQHGADPSVRNLDRQTTLDVAIMKEHIEVIQILIKHGAEDEALRKYGQPLVHSAKTTRQWKRSSDTLSMVYRATGCVGIKREGRSSRDDAALYLLYTIQPFHDLLRDIVSSASINDSIITAMEHLFTKMETSPRPMLATEVNDAIIQKEDPIRKHDFISKHDFTSKYGFIHKFVRLIEHFDNVLRDTPLFAKYCNLFSSEIFDIRVPGPAVQSWYIRLPGVILEDLESFIEKWSLDRTLFSPHYGLARWRFERPALVLIFEFECAYYGKASLISVSTSVWH
ncbi:MAG: hypothetical protein LQ352_005234 [Teloschistes flavicans]|nr:MAG: hypothetical protein LQ352_005234 [Teloschistes flavicans]